MTVKGRYLHFYVINGHSYRFTIYSTGLEGRLLYVWKQCGFHKFSVKTFIHFYEIIDFSSSNNFLCYWSVM